MDPLELIDLDELTEHLNVGVGHAAGLLNSLVGRRIGLEVPHIEIFPRKQINEALKKFGLEKYSTVNQKFSGDISGSASLLFSHAASTKFVNLVGEMMGSEASNDAIRVSTLKEIGNILINSVMGTISNAKGYYLNISLPDFYDLTVPDLIESIDSNHSIEAFLIAESVFKIEGEMIKGTILILLELSALAKFASKK